MTGARVRRSRRGAVALLGLLVTMPGCTWQAYAVSRGVRYATGVQTRVHVITPVTASVRDYRVIEVQSLENLLPGHVPPHVEAFVNARILEELRLLSSSPYVLGPDDQQTEAAIPAAPVVPTLLVDGFIDDFDPGIAALRLAELGFNHIALTVRVRLRDKETGQVLGAASVTAQDNRVTATSTATVRRLARRLRSFINGGYDQH
jgi:hypothetical protein